MLSVFLLFVIWNGKGAYANERTIDLYLTEETKESGIAIRGGNLTGGVSLLPGSPSRSIVCVHNQTKEELYIRWDAVVDRTDTELYRQLSFRFFDEDGTLVYEGKPKEFVYRCSPLKKNTSTEWTAELYISPEADNRISKDSLQFDMILRFSDDPLFRNAPAISRVLENAGGSGGMGHRYYTEDPADGPGRLEAGPFPADEDGNPLIESSYDRNGVKAPASGFAFDREYFGGGPPKVYGAPLKALGQGIDRGQWVLVNAGKQQWKYRLPDGTYLKSGFALVYNPWRKPSGTWRWYHFDENGIMSVGWIRAEGEIWYHAHEISDGDLGALETGWIMNSEDGIPYFCNERDSSMMTGWVGFKEKDGTCRYSYFARLEDTYRRNWFFNTAAGRWLYDHLGHRSYGSMYRNEQTPDGRRVDAEGFRADESDE